MSIDMSQFYQVFFEESQEHLDSMESLLLGLDIDDPDAEQLNAIFRAAHSIKGSAGTFGFTDLAEVTHVLENLLDRIRKGELALRPEMIDAFLDAGDILKELLAAHRGDGEADQEQDRHEQEFQPDGGDCDQRHDQSQERFGHRAKCRADQLVDLLDIVGHAGHQIANPLAAMEGLTFAKQAQIQLGAGVTLNPLG